MLIAGRELKDEQGAQEVGEEGAGSPLSQPGPARESSAGPPDKRRLCSHAAAALFASYSHWEMTFTAAPGMMLL